MENMYIYIYIKYYPTTPTSLYPTPRPTTPPLPSRPPSPPCGVGVGGGYRGGGGSRMILDVYIHMYLGNGSVQIAHGSVRILKFAGSVPPASKIRFAGPKTWDVKTDADKYYEERDGEIFILLQCG
jgi:hypothetical protein